MNTAVVKGDENKQSRSDTMCCPLMMDIMVDFRDDHTIACEQTGGNHTNGWHCSKTPTYSDEGMLRSKTGPLAS